MPRVYVAFILDMIIFNKIINNNRPPAWYFSDQDGKQGIYNCWPNKHSYKNLSGIKANP